MEGDKKSFYRHVYTIKHSTASGRMKTINIPAPVTLFFHRNTPNPKLANFVSIQVPNATSDFVKITLTGEEVVTLRWDGKRLIRTDE